jgi:polar amino acid transport system permease protein
MLVANQRAASDRNRDTGQIVVVPRVPYGQWALGAFVLLLVGSVGYSLWSNPRLERDVIGQYLFSPLVLRGVLLTLELTAITFFFGVVLGLILALMRRSHNPVLSAFAWTYTWVFRAVPPLVQLILWAFLAALYPRIEFGIPFTSYTFFSADTNDIMKPFVAAIVGFSLIEAAYQAEVFRAGLLSVPTTQSEAAQALGYSRWQAFVRVILPQAMPAVVPPSSNNLITLLKGTSLVSVIGATELLTSVQHVYAQTYQIIPLLLVASIWYLILTSALMLAQRYLERYYSRGRLAVGGESL